jgi:hypothetical protein
MRKTSPVTGLVAVVLALVACASGAPIIDSYRAPGTVSIVFNKVAVLVLNGGPERRAALEDQIVSSSNGSRLVAAHTLLTTEDQRSAASVGRKLLAEHCDGAATLRLIRPEEVNPAASDPGVSFSSYASSVSPEEPVFGGKILVEASFYDLSDEKLVWRGIVECQHTTDPASVAREAVDAIRKELRGTGLVHD